MIYSYEWLKNRLAQPNPPKLIGFFGNKADNFHERIFSNFYESPFIADFWGEPIIFNCVEQCFMYAKACTFGDIAIRDEIVDLDRHPADYKLLGKQVRNYDDAVWSRVRTDIMYKALYCKFTQNPALRAILLQTQDAVLVETSPHDTIWGIGVGKTRRPGQKAVDWTDIRNWEGENLLGFTLMEVRDAIRNDIHKVQPSMMN